MSLALIDGLLYEQHPELAHFCERVGLVRFHEGSYGTPVGHHDCCFSPYMPSGYYNQVHVVPRDTQGATEEVAVALRILRSHPGLQMLVDQRVARTVLSP